MVISAAESAVASIAPPAVDPGQSPLPVRFPFIFFKKNTLSCFSSSFFRLSSFLYHILFVAAAILCSVLKPISPKDPSQPPDIAIFAKLCPLAALCGASR